MVSSTLQFKVTELWSLGTDFIGERRINILQSILQCQLWLMLCQHFHHHNSQHSRVYKETVKFHHKLKFCMHELSLKQTFHLKKNAASL